MPCQSDLELREVADPPDSFIECRKCKRKLPERLIGRHMAEHRTSDSGLGSQSYGNGGGESSSNSFFSAEGGESDNSATGDGINSPSLAQNPVQSEPSPRSIGYSDILDASFSDD